MVRIIFAGTPDFALPSLDALAASDHDLIAVLTQPDRPAGRGRGLRPGPVKRRALELGLRVEQPPGLKTAESQAMLAELAPDLMVVVAYGLILPTEVLTMPRLGCINVHASLLPRWRGAAPIQRAVLAGDEESGVSIMRIDTGLDTGDVLLQKRTGIGARETGGELHDRLARLGAEALMEALTRLETGNATAVPQDDALASYATKLEKAEALIDWSGTAAQLARQVRAFNPWPVAETRFEGKQLRIWEAEAVGLAHPDGTEPGEVLAVGPAGIDVATGDGVLRILSLQLQGRRQLSSADFVNAVDLRHQRLGDPRA